MKVLAGRGLISLGRGRRATVIRPSADLLGDHLSALTRRDPASLLELANIRDSLDGYVVELAATSHAPTRGPALMVAEQACERMEHATDAAQFQDANAEFHRALVAAAGNEVLGFLLDGIEITLGSTVRSAYHGQLTRTAPPGADSVKVHRDILTAVDGRNSALAQRLAGDHARGVRRGLHQRIAAVLSEGERSEDTVA